MIRRYALGPLPSTCKGALSKSTSPAHIWVTSSISDFADLWPRSDNLGAARAHAFQCFNILELHRKTVGVARRAEPYFVAVISTTKEPLALLPLAIERRYGVRFLTFMDGGLADYNAPVLFPGVRDWNLETVEMLWRCLQQNLPFDIATFEKMPASVGDLPNPLKLLSQEAYAESCHLVSISGTWEELLSRLPRRSTLRRRIRQLNARGKVTFEFAQTPEQYDIFVEALIQQKSRRYIETRGTDSLDSLGYRDYLKAARNLIPPYGPVYLFALKMDETIIATHFGYVVGDRFHCLMPSFEGGEWRAYSPGNILAERIFEWCVANGIRVFDYGVGDDQYKREYCDISTALYQAKIPSTFVGRVYLGTRNVKQYIRRSIPPIQKLRDSFKITRFSLFGPAHDFLNPNPFNRLDVFFARRAIVGALKEQLPKFHGTLLDVGCGEMPYKPILLAPPSRVTKYIGLDLKDGEYSHFGPFDLEWDGQHIPVPNNSIDCAIATEVLEQCSQPEVVMSEVARVLKTGGRFFFTVPFLWPIHSPFDQYRFTPYALTRQLGDAGFMDVDIRILGGWDASIAQMIALWVRRRPMNRGLRVVLTVLALPVTALLTMLDRPPTSPQDFQRTVMITGISGVAIKSKTP